MYYLNDLGLLCTLGCNQQEVRAALVRRKAPVPEVEKLLQLRGQRYVGAIGKDLKPLPEHLSAFECYNNRLAVAALEQIRPALEAASQRYGSERIGVVMGTSTSGIVESERAVRQLRNAGDYPPQYHALQGILGGLGEFVSAYLETAGPVSTVSTACSSSANALLSARRLLQLDLCDAVVVGGVDSLCDLTVKGFGSLEALAAQYSKPFTAGRDGINIGEAAAVFLMSRDPGGVALMGGSGSSDAHHISAPHPEGEGAFTAMESALADAQLQPDDIDYLNAHGTGTRQNDAMESKAINRLFGPNLPCSSTKSMTGHTLGASGALELAFCWLLLTQGEEWRLPPSLYTDEQDTELAQIRLTAADDYSDSPPRYCMSNSFAFGGSNVALIIGVGDG